MKLKDLGILPKKKNTYSWRKGLVSELRFKAEGYNQALQDCGEVKIEINKTSLSAEICKFFAEQCEKGNLVHKNVEYKKLAQSITKALPTVLKCQKE